MEWNEQNKQNMLQFKIKGFWGKRRKDSAWMESLLLWDEMDIETDSQKILELRVASQVDMQKNLLREIWLNVNNLMKSFLRKQKKSFFF